ncbi:MAG TPA: 3-hydroxyacyl-CoA dehydrogenase NAD-binding domain-containing protein, partial [Cyclobacteriaceae bacterium]|nr:3-hydroxyacyl-CoA dehydrogenase NAD-binding domain-containing protein [Cyclobacteriaceae bacterium]
MTRIQSIAVVGAGTMGLGIAQVCATAGFKTILFDINATQLQLAVDTISNNLSRLVVKNKLSSTLRDKALASITVTHELAEVRADMIIEAAVEKLHIKQELFAQLEKINGHKSILATNTSSISVTQIAEKLIDKSRCIGLHFFNPADRMMLVEIISGAKTDPTLVDALNEFSALIGKTPVLAKDSPGFIVNRVARHFYVESL